MESAITIKNNKFTIRREIKNDFDTLPNGINILLPIITTIKGPIIAYGSFSSIAFIILTVSGDFRIICTTKYINAAKTAFIHSMISIGLSELLEILHKEFSVSIMQIITAIIFIYL